MSYNYKAQREKLFTDEGQRMFLAIRDAAQTLLLNAGAFKMTHAWDCTGEAWAMMACVDRMVELGEIKEITNPDTRAQDRVFVKA